MKKFIEKPNEIIDELNEIFEESDYFEEKIIK